MADALERAGISTVLCGGAVVSIYTGNRYESHDLDFVTATGLDELGDVMSGLGFQREGRAFAHPDSRLTVEFPPAPIEIGRLYLAPEECARSGSLRLLSPTQSVCDRLAAYIHWQDRQGLEQAAMIVKSQPVEMGTVRKWVRGETDRDVVEELMLASRIRI